MAAGNLQHRIHAYLSALHRANRFQGCVCLVRGSTTLFAAAYGEAEHRLHRANRIDTLFPIGSVSKQFTAAAVLQMSERRQLLLDQPLGAFLPYAVPAGAATIRQLLTHTGGLPPEAPDRDRPPAGLADLAERLADLRLHHPPGTGFLYSNLGYLLLAQIVEAISGRAFCDHLRDNVLLPAGLRRTACCTGGIAAGEERAGGYRPSGGALSPCPEPQFRAMVGAGSLCAPAAELAAWPEAVAAGSVLGSASRKLLFAPPEWRGGYGYGLIAERAAGRRRLRHNGALPGFRSMFLHYPDERITAVLLANLAPVPLQALERDLPALVFGGTPRPLLPPAKATGAVTADQAARVVGSYRLLTDPDERYVVEYRGGRTLLRDPNGEEQTLLPTERPGCFLVADTEETMEFRFGPDGRADFARYITLEGWIGEFERCDTCKGR